MSPYTLPWYASVLSIGALGVLLAINTGPAEADEWTGSDKTLHAAGGAVIGAGITAYTKSPLKGCAAATAVGAAKELADKTVLHGNASAKDFIVTAAAGCLASGVTGLVITPNAVIYRKEF